MKSTIGFIIFVLLTVGLLFSISGKRYPRIPADAIHKDIAVNNIAACMECHGAGKKDAVKIPILPSSNASNATSPAEFQDRHKPQFIQGAGGT